MYKIILFVVLMLLYPLFLQQIHITDLRVVPLVIPYALGCLAAIIIGSELAGFFFKKRE
ncbi:hypothetical protein RAC89_11405 [Paenibacillus sp. GD4]|uniref:hypothetical protein n=1 Tax=Paenibacillus sp. GD4 TaxID=3068890 RepID=UPI002796C502|nr:hypothetical protein [Paenibacillus sp. GD4]MDQ1911057.1 hypothetical protein [Paenibacillus sp. GD4]